MGRYGLILSGFYIINFPACDPTSPKVPKPSKWLKLDPRFFIFSDLWPQIINQKITKMGLGRKVVGLGEGGIFRGAEIDGSSDQFSKGDFGGFWSDLGPILVPKIGSTRGAQTSWIHQPLSIFQGCPEKLAAVTFEEDFRFFSFTLAQVVPE